jgi:hypothetical protein
MTGPHPARYSPEVLEIVKDLITPGEIIHDPFAGTGVRLGQLCDRIGATYTGTWPDGDPRVIVADARDATGYPVGSFTVVTSPVYANKRLADYPEGPKPTTKTRGRRDYGIALGRALHPDNLARFTGHQDRPGRAHRYWSGHAEAVKLWSDRAIVNVDEPLRGGWCGLLDEAGFCIEEVIPAYTQRYGGLDNAEKRAEYEVVIVASPLT